MRVRIIKQPVGTIDGVDVWKLVEGRLYEIHESLGDLLIQSHWAERVADDPSRIMVPLMYPVVTELLDRVEQGIAADRPPRRPKQRSD